jgi:hypothetical protein
MALLTHNQWIGLGLVAAIEVAAAGFLWYALSPPLTTHVTDLKPVTVQPIAPKPIVRPQPGKPRRINRPRPVNCRWVPAQAYQWPEGTVLSYAQQNYRLTPTQLRVLKYCVEHHK